MVYKEETCLQGKKRSTEKKMSANKKRKMFANKRREDFFLLQMEKFLSTKRNTKFDCMMELCNCCKKKVEHIVSMQFDGKILFCGT